MTDSRRELAKVYTPDEIKKIETNLIEGQTASELYETIKMITDQEEKGFHIHESELTKSRVLIRTLYRIAYETCQDNLSILIGYVIELTSYSDKESHWREALKVAKKALKLKEITKYPGRKAEFYFALFGTLYKLNDLSNANIYRQEIYKLSQLSEDDIQLLNPIMTKPEREFDLSVIREFESRARLVHHFLIFQPKEKSASSRKKCEKRKRQKENAKKRESDQKTNVATTNRELKKILINLKTQKESKSSQLTNQTHLLAYCSEHLATRATNFENLVKELIELSQIIELRELKSDLHALKSETKGIERLSLMAKEKKAERLSILNEIAKKQAELLPNAQEAQVILAALHLWGCGIPKDVEKAQEYLHFDTYGVMHEFDQFSIRNWLKSCVTEERFRFAANNKKELQKLSLFCLVQSHVQEEEERLTAILTA